MYHRISQSLGALVEAVERSFCRKVSKYRPFADVKSIGDLRSVRPCFVVNPIWQSERPHPSSSLRYATNEHPQLPRGTDA